MAVCILSSSCVLVHICGSGSSLSFILAGSVRLSVPENHECHDVWRVGQDGTDDAHQEGAGNDGGLATELVGEVTGRKKVKDIHAT